MKSAIKNKLPIQWGKTLVVEDLHVNENNVKLFKENLQKNNPSITPEELEKEVQSLVMKDNFYNKVMDEIASKYEIEFNEEELMEQKTNFKAIYTNFDDTHLTNLTKISIIKQLVYQDLASYWGIEITDDIVKATLENFYKTTGNPIREYLVNREKFDEIKKTILEQSISERILNAFKAEFKLKKNKNLS